MHNIFRYNFIESTSEFAQCFYSVPQHPIVMFTAKINNFALRYYGSDRPNKFCKTPVLSSYTSRGRESQSDFALLIS